MLDSNAPQFVANTGAGSKQNPTKPTSFLFLDSNVPQFVAKKRKRSTNPPHSSLALSTKNPTKTPPAKPPNLPLKFTNLPQIPQTSNNTLKKVKICNCYRNKYDILKTNNLSIPINTQRGSKRRWKKRLAYKIYSKHSKRGRY